MEKKNIIIIKILSFFCFVRDPKLTPGFEVWPHQGPVQGDGNCPEPAGRTSADTS